MKIKIESTDVLNFNVIFSPKFIANYTDFSSIEEFFDKSPYKFNNKEEFDKIDEKEFDKYVVETTKFTSWEEMKVKAFELHAKTQLRF